MLALVVIATAVRFFLITQSWPSTNSDESNMGILARHVAYNGAWPIFFYGLPYMGPVEGYLAAPLFHLFGATLFSLRLGLLPFYILFLVAMYFLTRLLYTRGLALATLLFLSLGSEELFSRELKAVGEYPETLAFAAWISLLFAWLIMSEPASNNKRRRLWIYGALGLITGLALWVDLLILPFIATAGLILLIYRRHELFSWSVGLIIVAGIIIGAFPLLIYNLTAPFSQNSLFVLIGIHSSHSSLAENSTLLWLQKVIGAVMISIPHATGYNTLCTIQDMPTFGPLNMQCLLLQGGWGLGYVILLGLALLLTWRPLWRLWRHISRNSRWSLPDWNAEDSLLARLHSCRFMLLLSGLLTLLAYMPSASAAVYPITSARYLTGLLVVLPATLWPLWHGMNTKASDTAQKIRRSSFFSREHLRVGFLIRAAFLLIILSMFILGTVKTFQAIPAAQRDQQREAALIQRLTELGVTRFYSEYWTCNRLIFHSEERLICIALDEDLEVGFNRYKPYIPLVQETPDAAYVFPLDSDHARAFEQRQQSLAQPYQRIEQGGHVIYLAP